MPASNFLRLIIDSSLEVVAKAQFQADLGSFLEVIETHVNIKRWLQCNMIVQEEAVTSFEGQIDIVKNA